VLRKYSPTRIVASVVLAGLLVGTLVWSSSSYNKREPAHLPVVVETKALEKFDGRAATNDAATNEASAAITPTKTSVPEVQPHTVTVVFPDGDIEIMARPIRTPPFPRPARLVDVYADVRALADKGDASAAFMLNDWLTQCGYGFEDQQSLDDAIRTLRRDRVLIYPDKARPKLRLKEQDAVEFYETILGQAFEWCQGISANQKAEAGFWLSKAAEGGELLALQQQAMESNDVETHWRGFQELWDRKGFTGALAPLALMFKQGNVPGGQRDYVRSYMYQLIEFKLAEAVYGQSAFPYHRNKLRGLEEVLANTASHLTPAETNQAIEAAKRNLQQHPSCCIGFTFGVN
jgi:hypothetical protein